MNALLYASEGAELQLGEMAVGPKEDSRPCATWSFPAASL
eukprot:CAMPEP_0113272552 /NCGR_PEP_ID=MMETSP0008_2-20120614/23384_1 /TAXON_ID=97485 /ORGANISM="Prymnesium parvum" /LENGTH=39 /DNA_ID=CAMNT_0000122021 /DNA_START=248 /DNA_END=367 /DNA_ORIENTATION=- /assembly_acc=CAM_ASM_000153